MHFAEPSPTVQADHVQLQQVSLNLIVNAAEAQRARRSTRVADFARRKRKQTARWWRTTFGSGIGSEECGPSIEAFCTTKVRGVDIGLTVCRSMIEAHGGRILAGANEPRGFSFRFTLPLERDENVPAGPVAQVCRCDEKRVIAKCPSCLPEPPDTPSTSRSSMADRRWTGRTRAPRFWTTIPQLIECMSKGNFLFRRLHPIFGSAGRPSTRGRLYSD